jgi:hypothetical protein
MHKQQQQQQHAGVQQATAWDDAALLVRQQRACLFVSQLLVCTSQPVMLAVSAAAKAAAEPSPLLQAYSCHLLSAVCGFLAAALPVAVHHHLLLSTTQRQQQGGVPSASTLQGGAPIASSSSCGHLGQQQRAGGVPQQGGAWDSSAAAAAADTRGLQPALLLLQVCQLLQHLPPKLQQHTSCLQLLCSAVTCAAAAGALPAAECIVEEPAVAQHQPQQQQQPQPQPQPQQQQPQQCLAVLQQLVGAALGGACSSIVQQQGAAQPEHTTAAIALAVVCVQCCPAVLAHTDLGVLLLMMLVAARTHHLRQVTAVLNGVQVLTSAAYAGQPQARPQQQQHDGAGGGGGAAGPGVLAALRSRLEAGAGAQLVLALLLAASGGMPSDVVLPVSHALHALWLAVGKALFERWLQDAVLTLAPPGAPWAQLRHVSKLAFLHDIADRACVTDTARFKRLLKVGCGAGARVWC